MSVVENLRFKRENLNLSISRWEIPDQGVTAVQGPSGCGKTTLARILIGLEDCSGWSWRFGDEDLAQLPPPQRRIGMVFQDFALFPHLSAKDNIYFASKARGIESAKADELYTRLHKKLQLSSFENRKARYLSGGEKQRTALARALMGRPRFLILDEPFSALDQNLRQESRHLVKDIIHEFQIPSLLISHDPKDIEAMAESILKL